MEALVKPAGDKTWIIALSTLSLSVSLAIGRYHGNVIDFIAGFFLGVALALSVYYLVVAFRRRSRS